MTGGKEISPASSAVIAAVVGVGAAGVEALVPGAGVALAGFAPLVGHAVERAWSRVFSIATAESGLTPSEIGHRLGELDNGIRLLSRTIDAVRVAPYEEKLRVLGRALANAATDPALIDQELLLVLAVAALEPHHLRLLRAGAEIAKRPRDDDEQHLDGDWNTRNVQEVDPGLTPDVVVMLAGTLAGLGLTESQTAMDISVYTVTALGALLLERAGPTGST